MHIFQIRKFPLAFLIICLVSLAGCEEPEPGDPKITALRLISMTPSIGPLQIESRCENCDESKTSYSWYVEGIDEPVSTGEYYSLPNEYLTRKLTIFAQAENNDGRFSKTEHSVYYHDYVKEIVANDKAFAAITSGNYLEAWGEGDYGGLLFPENESLFTDNVAIYKSSNGFSVLKTDGSIQSWHWFDINVIEPSLVEGIKLESISGSGHKFTAFKDDGSVVTWSDNGSGLDTSTELEAVRNVVSVHDNYNGKVALHKDGTISTWDFESYLSIPPPTDLENIETIYQTVSAYAAKGASGKVVTWGGINTGGDSSSVSEKLLNVTSVHSNSAAFVALLTDRTVVSWGSRFTGGDSSDVESELYDIVSIYSVDRAFAALREDGSVIIWGNDEPGGIYTTNVISVYSTDESFAFLKADGSVVVWGGFLVEGTYSVASDHREVVSLHGNDEYFLALKADGSVKVLNRHGLGIDEISAEEKLVDVVSIHSNEIGFSALKTNGSVAVFPYYQYQTSSSPDMRYIETFTFELFSSLESRSR